MCNSEYSLGCKTQGQVYLILLMRWANTQNEAFDLPLVVVFAGIRAVDCRIPQFVTVAPLQSVAQAHDERLRRGGHDRELANLNVLMIGERSLVDIHVYFGDGAPDESEPEEARPDQCSTWQPGHPANGAHWGTACTGCA